MYKTVFTTLLILLVGVASMAPRVEAVATSFDAVEVGELIDVMDDDGTVVGWRAFGGSMGRSVSTYYFMIDSMTARVEDGWRNEFVSFGDTLKLMSFENRVEQIALSRPATAVLFPLAAGAVLTDSIIGIGEYCDHYHVAIKGIMTTGIIRGSLYTEDVTIPGLTGIESCREFVRFVSSDSANVAGFFCGDTAANMKMLERRLTLLYKSNPLARRFERFSISGSDTTALEIHAYLIPSAIGEIAETMVNETTDKVLEDNTPENIMAKISARLNDNGDGMILELCDLSTFENADIKVAVFDALGHRVSAFFNLGDMTAARVEIPLTERLRGSCIVSILVNGEIIGEQIAK